MQQRKRHIENTIGGRGPGGRGSRQHKRNIPGKVTITSPLNSSLKNKKNAFSKTATSPQSCLKSKLETFTPKTGQKTKSVNIYIGENFSVRLNEYFKLIKCINDNKEGGLIQYEYDPFRRVRNMKLSEHAQKLQDVPNAGGSSVISEVMSYEVLKRCFGAKLLKTEMEVSYFPEGGSITDYVCEMFSTRLGVSVTRAMKYRGEYTDEDAEKLLVKKLTGVIQATQNSLENWSKQILHVWATSTNVANTIIKTYHKLPEHIKCNTVVIVTIAHNSPEIFFNM
ncbi:unnamed protein product [Owenia fusiformis]|uniref:Uncharacterized protein n=1 Tax=Owenia fusiformis TaxID=6347 RepID=A0A8J1UCM6_OWEFU|nr:unnamed protein product [Owenia fusiformis]